MTLLLPDPLRTPATPAAADDRERLLADLHDVVAALDKRTRHPERPAERAIATQASALRAEAVHRIGALERPEPGP